MSTQELFELLKKEVGDKLNGSLKYTGDVIKYEYCAFSYDFTEEELEQYSYEDRCIIDEWLEENDDEYFTTEPEIDTDIVLFYIEK